MLIFLTTVFLTIYCAAAVMFVSGILALKDAVRTLVLHTRDCASHCDAIMTTAKHMAATSDAHLKKFTDLKEEETELLTLEAVRKEFFSTIKATGYVENMPEYNPKEIGYIRIRLEGCFDYVWTNDFKAMKSLANNLNQKKDNDEVEFIPGDGEFIYFQAKE